LSSQVLHIAKYKNYNPKRPPLGAIFLHKIASHQITKTEKTFVGIIKTQTTKKQLHIY